MTDAKKDNATPREPETKEAFEAAFDNALERAKKIFPETNKLPIELMGSELGISEYAVMSLIFSHCEETNLRFNGGHVYRCSEAVAATAPRKPATADEMREIIWHVARYFSDEDYFIPEDVMQKIADIASENVEGKQ